MRGWRVAEWAAPAYRPLNDFLNRLPPKNRAVGELLGWHNRFWLNLAQRHTTSD